MLEVESRTSKCGVLRFPTRIFQYDKPERMLSSTTRKICLSWMTFRIRCNSSALNCSTARLQVVSDGKLWPMSQEIFDVLIVKLVQRNVSRQNCLGHLFHKIGVFLLFLFIYLFIYLFISYRKTHSTNNMLQYETVGNVFLWEVAKRQWSTSRKLARSPSLQPLTWRLHKKTHQ